MTTQALTINFHGTDLFIIEQDGQPYTPMKTIVEGMGLNWASQFVKLKANEQRWGIVKIAIPTLGDMQEAICLPLRKLSGWLSTISPNKVKPELRDTIIYYQNECDDVLWEHWSKGQPQYGLKELPPSPYISESEAAQFMKSINAFCKSDGKSYPVLYHKVYEYFGITSYKNIPAGKLEDAARLCGFKLLGLAKPKMPEALPVTEIAVRTKVLVVIDGDSVRQSVVPYGSCIIDPGDAVDLKTLLTEYVPGELLTVVLDACCKRLPGYIEMVNNKASLKA